MRLKSNWRSVDFRGIHFVGSPLTTDSIANVQFTIDDKENAWRINAAIHLT